MKRNDVIMSHTLPEEASDRARTDKTSELEVLSETIPSETASEVWDPTSEM